MSGSGAAGLALDARDIRVAYADPAAGARTVLEIAGLRIEGGAQVAICGPSGSGKTTLLNVLAGIERPERGVVRWGEVDVAALAERVGDRWRRETVGLVFQQFHLFAGLSALENVLLPLRFDRWSVPPSLRARALELVDRVGVPAAGDVAKLSRGELQRVAVARALLRNPAIVLADEPTASLDRANAEAIVDLVVSMCHRARATLVVATHDSRVAARFERIFDVAERDLRLRPAAGARSRPVLIT